MRREFPIAGGGRRCYPRRMKTSRIGMIIGLLLTAGAALAQAGLPAETTVTKATKFEILRNEQVSGTVKLSPGAKLEVFGLTDGFLQVRFRSLAGRVAAADTELAAFAAAVIPAQPTVVPAPAVAAAPGTPPAAKPPAVAPPATGELAPFARTLGAKLVRWENGALKPHDQSRLAGVKFFALYFSASWCGPCRQFTPELVDAYGKIRAQYPEFELVFVSNDRSAADMQGYMSGDHMAWPAVRYDAIRNSRDITRYAGDGIPCLVLVDAEGKVLSDSFRGGGYVGPDAVLDDTWKILRDHRRQLAGKKS